MIRIVGCLVLALSLAATSLAGAGQVDEFLWPGRAESSASHGDFENGVSAARAGDWRMSVRLLERSVSRDPQDADALTMLAFGNRQLGRLAPAMRYYRAALIIEPGHRLANLRIAQAYLAANQLAKARRHLEVLSKACPKGCAELEALDRAIAGHKIKGPDS
ncbi:MAG: tetratricopeptide repeat protein [Alphaproteobacteria bacterium]